MAPVEKFIIRDMERPLIAHREALQTYYDCLARTVYMTEEETNFPDGCLITSRTDVYGIITHANDSFVRMSGWERDEIVGQPHSILRHPDMPKIAFAGLWETLDRGEKWHGYVKNLRKDGGFYWVYATVVPNIRNGKLEGYTSVRRKPNRKTVEELAQVYATWLAEEKAKEAAEQGGATL